MTADDRTRWNRRYAKLGGVLTPHPPGAFAHLVDSFPIEGDALEIACGRGEASIWLAKRGLRVHGMDISATAVEQADQLADDHGLSDHTTFTVVDFDDGLPQGPPVAVVLCHRFRDPALYRPMAERVQPDGLLAISVLSEVGSEPGLYRAPAGELDALFAPDGAFATSFELLAADESHGSATVLARRRTDSGEPPAG